MKDPIALRIWVSLAATALVLWLTNPSSRESMKQMTDNLTVALVSLVKKKPFYAQVYGVILFLSYANALCSIDVRWMAQSSALIVSLHLRGTVSESMVTSIFIILYLFLCVVLSMWIAPPRPQVSPNNSECSYHAESVLVNIATTLSMAVAPIASKLLFFTLISFVKDESIQSLLNVYQASFVQALACEWLLLGSHVR